MLIKIKKSSDIAESEVTDQGLYQSRRTFIKSATGFGIGGALLSGLAGNSSLANAMFTSRYTPLKSFTASAVFASLTLINLFLILAR